MPSWKKIITSGSSAHLHHVSASGNISGSLTTTGSFGTIQTTTGTIPTLIGDTTFRDALTLEDNLYIPDSIVHASGTNTKIRFPEADTIAFNTSGVERMRISAAGHVTASGDVSSSASSTGSFGRLQASVLSGNSPIRIEADNITLDSDGTVSGSSTSTGSFGHVVIAGTPILSNDGNKIGIGSSHSANKISDWSVTSTITVLNVQDEADGQGARVAIQGSDASLDLVDKGATGNQSWFSIYNQDQMVYLRSLNNNGGAVAQDFISMDLSNGRVGIGSSDAPSYDLDVSGTGRFTGALTLDSTISNIATTHVTASGNISGSSTSTGSFGHVHISDGLAGLGIGDDNDLLLYHNGNHSYIKDSGTGNLHYMGGTQTFQNGAGSKTMMVLNSANSVDLNYNNNTKFQTTNTGVSITGNVIATGTLRTNSGATMTGSLYVSGSIGGDAGAISASGDIVADGDIIAYNASDEKLKDNIEVIQGSLDKIGDIRGVEFDWNEKSPGWARERGHDVGVIAQEVQKVLPEIVTKRKNGYLGVDYKRIVPLLIESIKELKQEVEELKKKVN